MWGDCCWDGEIHLALRFPEHLGSQKQLLSLLAGYKGLLFLSNGLWEDLPSQDISYRARARDLSEGLQLEAQRRFFKGLIINIIYGDS